MAGCSSSPTGDSETLGAPRAARGRRGLVVRVRRFVRREHDEVSLRQALVNGLWQALVIPVVFGVAYVAASRGLPDAGVVEWIPGPVEEPTDRERHARQVRQLIVAHDCWVLSAPADMEGRMPGHAVVTWPGDDEPSYGGARAVKVGLGHHFEKAVAGFEPHAFCR